MRLLHFRFKYQNRPLKGNGAKRDVCRGTSVSSGGEVTGYSGAVGVHGYCIIFTNFTLWCSVECLSIHITNACAVSVCVKRNELLT